MAEFELSQRRASSLFDVDPKTIRRTRAPDSQEIRAMMHEIAAKRRRFGYRRIGILLERDGYKMNHKKLFRLYQEEGLAVKRRKGRKRASGSRSEMPVPELPGQRWSLDFVSDSLQSGRRLRILAVNDDCTRENLCLIADFCFTGERVAKELSALIRLYGRPDCIVRPHSALNNQPPAAARRALELYEGSAHATVATRPNIHYQTRRPSK